MKVGSLVRAAYNSDGHTGIFHTGTVVCIDEVTDLFSEKYAITETTTYIRILSGGSIMTFDMDEDQIEVINNENR